MTIPTYEICIDWSATDWAGAHDFTTSGDDITADVKSFRITRGKETEDNVYPSATLELILENSSGDYYPTLSTGAHYTVARSWLWLPVRVRATHLTVVYNLFYGFINRITCSPLRSKKEVYFYATDGLDLLAKTMVIQDMDDKTTMSDGDAIVEILDAAGWSGSGLTTGRRNIDDTGGEITSMPDTFAFTKP